MKLLYLTDVVQIDKCQRKAVSYKCFITLSFLCFQLLLSLHGFIYLDV